MTTIAQIKDGITHLGQQLAGGGTVTPSFIGEVLTQLVIFMEIMSKIETDQNRMNTQTIAEVGGIKERAAQQQGALEVLTNRSTTGDKSLHPQISSVTFCFDTIQHY